MNKTAHPNSSNKIFSQILFIVIVLFATFSLINIKAETISRDKWGALPQSVSTSNAEVSSPKYFSAKGAYVFEINPISKKYSRSCTNWVKSLQYYFQNRLGFEDIPANIVICDNKVYTITTTINESLPIENMDNHIVIFHYGSVDNLLPATLSEALKGTTIANSNLSLKKLNLKLDKDQALASVSVGESVENATFSDIISKVSISNADSLKIVSVQKSTTDTSYDITIHNSSKYVLSWSNVSEHILAVNNSPFDGKSSFYIDENSWASFSRAMLLNSDSNLLILPNKNVTMTLNLKNTGAVASFVLTDLSGKQFTDTGFQINTKTGDTNIDHPYVAEFGNIENIDMPTSTQTSSSASTATTTTATVVTTTSAPVVTKQYAKIISQFGYLRVRAGPGAAYGQVATVNTGEEYEILEKSGEWIKIQVGDTIGWVLRIDNNYTYVQIIEK